MNDPFEPQKTEIYQPPSQEPNFSDFNIRWLPTFDEGIKTKIGTNLEKGSDILKKASSFYVYGLGLVTLLIILPPVIRFLYEFSSWLFDVAGNLFP